MAKHYIDDFDLNVSRELVQGGGFLHRAFLSSVFGVTENSVWANASLFIPPTTAATMNVVSTSADDTTAGTGARTLMIVGLDSNYAEISENLILNGTTPVTTTKSYLRLTRATVVVAGAAGSNVGAITLTGANLMGIISVNDGQTTASMYTVPAGKVAYLHNLHLSSSKNTDGKVTVRTRLNTVSRVRHTVQLTGDSYTVNFRYPTVLAEKTDIELRAVANTGNGIVAGSYDLFLVDKPIVTMGGTGIPDPII